MSAQLEVAAPVVSTLVGSSLYGGPPLAISFAEAVLRHSVGDTMCGLEILSNSSFGGGRRWIGLTSMG